jgi:hypothetical protein
MLIPTLVHQILYVFYYNVHYLSELFLKHQKNVFTDKLKLQSNARPVLRLVVLKQNIRGLWIRTGNLYSSVVFINPSKLSIFLSQTLILGAKKCIYLRCHKHKMLHVIRSSINFKHS